jgi:CheY-like chemotaxis protein
MPISREFVRLMGGDLTVSSQAARGTVFCFTIPVRVLTAREVAPVQPLSRVTGLEPGSHAPDGGAYRVLVVDDAEPSRQLLLKLLRPVGLQVRTATNGQEGIKIWKEWQPHLVWMDVRMPSMDGYEVTRHIRSRVSEQKGGNPIIVAVTAGGFAGERAAALAAGCDDFLLKPFRAADVFEMLTRHLGVQLTYEQMQYAQDDPLPALSVEGMPDAWLADMRQAVVEGDLGWIMRLIEDVRVENPALADALIALTRGFEHDRLLELVQQAGVGFE